MRIFSNRRFKKRFVNWDLIYKVIQIKKHIPVIDMSNGSLEQGISADARMVLVVKMDEKPIWVYTLLGDGELQVWEVAMLAGHQRLDNLLVIVDNNGLQIDGSIDKVYAPYPISDKFEAFGFYVVVVDAHNFEELEAAFQETRNNKGKLKFILEQSIKGIGILFRENQESWHGEPPNEEQYIYAVVEREWILNT